MGNFLLGTKGILDMLFTMANSEDPNQQLVAAEAIVHAASKKDKSAAILADGYALLQRLAKSPNDNVQVNRMWDVISKSVMLMSLVGGVEMF